MERIKRIGEGVLFGLALAAFLSYVASFSTWLDMRILYRIFYSVVVPVGAVIYCFFIGNPLAVFIAEIGAILLAAIGGQRLRFIYDIKEWFGIDQPVETVLRVILPLLIILNLLLIFRTIKLRRRRK